MIGSDKIFYAYENSEVDPVNQKMVMESRNVTMSNTVSFQEKMDYSPDPVDPNRTIMKQQTIITVQGVPLTSYIENYLLNSVSCNSFKVSLSFFLYFNELINYSFRVKKPWNG